MNARLDSQREAWMTAGQTAAVLAALGEDNARFVGGCVRNALMGRAVDDIDIATPLLPAEVTRRLEAAGIKAVPTGIEHGTVTAVAGGKVFEITTLRRDVATDGRHAVVAFTQDWAEDAGRRDFTMNALYADADGTVHDYASGLDDLKAGRIRFVGDAVTRIREDYLRILRLYRFHAWYGKGEPDAGALHAAAAERGGLAQLSGERIAKEMLKLLAAPDPLASLRLMATAAILPEIMPGALNLTRAERLVATDRDCFFAADAGLRLAALLPDDDADVQALAGRWKLSNELRDRLADLASGREKIVAYLSMREVRKFVYRLGNKRFHDRVRLRWAEEAKASNAVAWRALVAMGDGWTPPRFPLTGRDVMAAGVAQGPQIGRILAEVEDWWIDADFTDDPFSLAERMKAVVQAMGQA